MSVRRILHYPGSKWSIAEWIISHMPEHQTYIEPFFGSGAVLFNKNASEQEVINDVSGDIVNLFRVIREQPEKLAIAIKLTPFAREEYDAAQMEIGHDIERARRFLIKCWQAIRVKTDGKSGYRCAYGDKVVRDWNYIPDRIMIAADRLKQVNIENKPAIEIIKRFNRPEVLIYADPPYVLSSRVGKLYQCEMTEEEHMILLDSLNDHSGPAIISGYESQLYKEKLVHWKREVIKGKVMNFGQRTEVIWINPIAAATQEQISLFEWEGSS
ncbi:DNA adenine methylase [Paenibacillus cymbidii]|uniref:DNA adenine methylase n=1 Tax=Paenibacillus cymbidii TaxID=1639034 RepID=UPI001080F0B3|nr:DNA adenine methylase [Paenibacillus cymbidii]